MTEKSLDQIVADNVHLKNQKFIHKNSGKRYTVLGLYHMQGRVMIFMQESSGDTIREEIGVFEYNYKPENG